MESLESLLQRLWDSFSLLNPDAASIRQAFVDYGEEVVNDHIAFRTFGVKGLGIDVVAEPFIVRGYLQEAEYQFPDRHVSAIHLAHTNPELPKIFISQLNVHELGRGSRDIVDRLMDTMDAGVLRDPEKLLFGTHWGQLTIDDYHALKNESEYGAWVACFGMQVNHFTVLVNALQFTDDINVVNTFVQALGHELNIQGGVIKGSPEQYLEQSSIMAPRIPVAFSDGTEEIPGSFYEFAKRYPDEAGKVFQGFIAESANLIFDSTKDEE